MHLLLGGSHSNFTGPRLPSLKVPAFFRFEPYFAGSMGWVVRSGCGSKNGATWNSGNWSQGPNICGAPVTHVDPYPSAFACPRSSLRAIQRTSLFVDLRAIQRKPLGLRTFPGRTPYSLLAVETTRVEQTGKHYMLVRPKVVKLPPPGVLWRL